jgi:hypothetical protein
MANANCKFWQSQLDDQEKNLVKYKAFGKLPIGVLFSPYETFATFIDKKEKSIDKLKKDIKINDCANDPSVKTYRRNKCLSLNQTIDSYTSRIASDYAQALTDKNAGEFNVNVWVADNLTKALNDAKKDFITYGCQAEVEASRQEVVAGIGAEYSAYDKIRIQAESIYERNKRVFFGAVVLIGALALIMTITSSKSKN